MVTELRTIRTKSGARRRVFSGTLCACGHYIDWWYAIDGVHMTDEVRTALEEAAEERARECLAEDYISGELNCVIGGEREVGGWWDIAR
jgi:hypothetical protein